MKPPKPIRTTVTMRTARGKLITALPDRVNYLLSKGFKLIEEPSNIDDAIDEHLRRVRAFNEEKKKR